MPELPETETIARDLDRAVAGAVIDSATVTHADVLREATPAQFRRRVGGATIRRCWRRAKLVVLDLSTQDRLVVQPRFTGALLVDTGHLPLAERRYTTIALHLADERVLRYRDIRRLGTVTVMAPERFAAYVGGLGPEPLDPDFTDETLRTVLERSSQPIKKVLMNQRQLAGVGNIYATESLWRAGIDPSRRARTITRDESRILRRTLVDLLNEAIDARGTSLRDYRDANGDRGTFAGRLGAYGHAGDPCPRCRGRLVGTHAIDGRMTVFCPRCQR